MLGMIRVYESIGVYPHPCEAQYIQHSKNSIERYLQYQFISIAKITHKVAMRKEVLTMLVIIRKAACMHS